MPFGEKPCSPVVPSSSQKQIGQMSYCATPPSVKCRQQGQRNFPFLPFGYSGSERLQKSAKLSKSPETGSAWSDTLFDSFQKFFGQRVYAVNSNFLLDGIERSLVGVHVQLAGFLGAFWV